MDQQQWKKINNIVDTALDLSGKERQTYIQEECKGNEQLKQQVTGLIASIEQSDTENFLEDFEDYPRHLAREISEQQSHKNTSSLIGTTIGSYKLIELIGHGGMGSVFLAERADKAYTQKVALKLMRRGMDTPSNIARFKRERQILANLNHPNIARLLDGGITNEGLPYLVMEFVEGKPLLEYCDQHRLDINERLKLFRSVCEAVQHAHNNAVIHRDLKPSNIMVTPDGAVKVLDFGIAKLLEPEDPGTKLFETQTGARILTLGYAAPEQVENQAITTKTDIYTLGILLYELFTGVHPFDMGEKDFTEIEDLIRHKLPSKPSAKFQDLDPVKQRENARLRNISGDNLINTLQGDLDAIILKTLRKEPEARYESVTQLLEDLDRREQNHPIIARRDTFRYKTSKFLRRYKTPLSTAVGILLIIAGIVIYYSWQITEERNIAQTEAEKAEQVTAFLTDLIESNYPENAQGDTITVREFLNQGYDRVQKLDQSPEIKANVMQVMAHTYRSLGEIDKAAPLMQQVVEIHDTLSIPPAEKAEAYNVQGLILRDEGDFKKAEKAMERAVALFQKAGESDTEEYSKLLADLAYVKRINANYDEALSMIEDAIDIKKSFYDSTHMQLAEPYYILASILRKKYNYQQAKRYQIKSLDILQTNIDGPHPGKANNLNNLAIIYKEQDSLNKAATHYQKSLAMSEKLYGESHPDIATISSNFSNVLLQQGKIDSAKKMMEQALQITRNELGNTHPKMGEYLNDYANTFRERGPYSKADSLYKQALYILEKHYPDNHPKIVGVLNNKAENAFYRGDIDQAESLFRKVLSIRKERYDSSAEDIQIPLQKLIDILESKGNIQEVDSLRNILSSTQ
ncbi:tetratricopeptide repeat protein [Fodinibius sp. AD559]|uniref:tetratricopeptide repeat protein n=1 Tax=Fodinibius sp. AD559 TaxID=3424179 RepID=UPI004046EA8C